MSLLAGLLQGLWLQAGVVVGAVVVAVVASTWYIKKQRQLVSVRPKKSLWAQAIVNDLGYTGLLIRYVETLRAGFRQSLRQTVSLVWVVPLVFGVGYLLPAIWQPLEQYTRSQVATLWQTQATLIGVSFVVIIFVLEYLQDQYYDVSVRDRFVAVSGVIPLLFLSMSALLFVGGYYLIGSDPIAMNGSAFLVGLNIIAIGYSYGRVASIAFRDPLDTFLREKTESSIETIATSVAEYEQANVVLTETPGVTTGRLENSRESLSMPSDDETPLHIADLDRTQLTTAATHSDTEPSISVNLRRSLPDAVQLTASNSDTAMHDTIADGLVFSSTNRWQPLISPFAQRLEQVRRFADEPIKSGDKSEFDKYVTAYEKIGKHAIRTVAPLNETVQSNVAQQLTTSIQQLFESTNKAADAHFARQLIDLIDQLLDEAADQDVPPFYTAFLTLWFECYTVDRRERQTRRLMREPLSPVQTSLDTVTGNSGEATLHARSEYVFETLYQYLPVVIETLDIDTLSVYLGMVSRRETVFAPQITDIAADELPPYLFDQDDPVYLTAGQTDTQVGATYQRLRRTAFLLGAAGLAFHESASNSTGRLPSVIESIITEQFSVPTETRALFVDILNADGVWSDWQPSEWHTHAPVVTQSPGTGNPMRLSDESELNWLYEFYALTQLVHIERPQDVPGHEHSGRALSQTQNERLNTALEKIATTAPLEQMFPEMYENIATRRELVAEEAQGTMR